MASQDLLLASRDELRQYRAQLAKWEEATTGIRAELLKIETPVRRRLEANAVEKFLPEYQALLARSPEELGPFEKQIRHLAQRQLDREARALEKSIKGEAKKKRDALKKKLRAFDGLRPRTLPRLFGAIDVGAVAPPTVIPGRQKESVLPGVPVVTPRGITGASVREPRTATAPNGESDLESTSGRRSALASWIGDARNGLTYRVLANRIWQHHFGVGIVSTSNDFGAQGEAPSHPKLLDWLAAELASRGGHWKDLHREILYSSTYRQSSGRATPTVAVSKDPDNRLLWKMRPRRLDAEILRDAMLFVSGDLDRRRGGPSSKHSGLRRSVYLEVRRNKRQEMLAAFDAPDHFSSCSRRESTTTAPQALLLLNGPWIVSRAESFAGRVLRSGPSRDGRIEYAVSRALGRSATDSERATLTRFLDENASKSSDRDAWVDICHVLLNTNEFLYVD
ncbi:MAG: DUF1553 domain-containing protein [Planctomycetota bacterium]